LVPDALRWLSELLAELPFQVVLWTMGEKHNFAHLKA